MRRSLGIYIAGFAFCVAVVVIVLGAYTRLVHAGLGCPDWPTCYSHFWVPNTPEEIHTANQNFSATPVEADKTWPEQIHRIFASSLGLLIIGLLIAVILFYILKRSIHELTAIKLATDREDRF